MVKIVLASAVCMSLAACATSNNKTNYESYLTTVQQIESTKAVAAEASRISKASEYANMQAACNDSACASTVAAFKAIADVVDSLAAGSGMGNASRVAAPQREPTMSEQLLSWASILVPGATTYANIVESNKTQRRMSDNQVTQQVSQNGMWATIFEGQSAALAAPGIVVGGNYGNTETNTAGTNLVSGDGNTIGNRNGNSGRQDSAGPYDYSGNCREGDRNCPVTVTNPDPTP